MSRAPGPPGSAALDTLSAGTIGSVSAQITPVVLAWNEAPNLARCLERLTWARRVVVLDSGSSDDTSEIARRFANVELHTRPFDDHATQWNHGISLAASPWVLSLDADYVVPVAFPGEAARVLADPTAVAASARFRYCVLGRPLRASLYPPRVALFKPDRCRYEMDGHTQRLVVTGGATVMLGTQFDHDDRKPLGRWLESQNKYASLEAAKLSADGERSVHDRLRKTLVLAPPAVFLYTLLVKGALFDGWPGWYYTLQRTLAEIIVSLHVLDRKLRGAPGSPGREL